MSRHPLRRARSRARGDAGAHTARLTRRTRAIRRTAGGALAIASAPLLLSGQTPPEPRGDTARLPAVEVRVTRERGRSVIDVPFAVALARLDSTRPGLRATSLDETLLLVPGVTVANRYNPTQDPRLSIRGFGARSAFGVRGVRVLRDGIPLTLPDGQTPIDYVELESVGRVEAIRGSASALYGNAAGGVVDLRSDDPPTDRTTIGARHLIDAAALQRTSLAIAGGAPRLGYQVSAAHTSGTGHRDYSRTRMTHGFARLLGRSAASTVGLTAMTFDMPTAENPGAITRDELRSDPSTADPQAVTRRASKAVVQRHLALTGSRRVRGGEIQGALHGSWRALDNPTPFAVIDLDRRAGGASARASMPLRAFGGDHLLTVGVDYQQQADDRQNFVNCAGSVGNPSCPFPAEQRGALTLDQREIVTSVGPYLRGDLGLTSRVRLGVGLRADIVRFELRDRFVTSTNPDDSGDRTLRAVSPTIGMLVRLRPWSALYLSVASGFETPTATELVNQPDGSAGLNRDLEPQTAVTYEAGVKGFLAARLRYDGALFVTRVRDELIPFEVAGGGGRRYFRNAGRTERHGAELAVAATTGALEWQAAYTYLRLRFDEYLVGTDDFSGNRIPGVPTQQAHLGLAWWRSSYFLAAEGIAASGAFVDDANSTRAPSYGVLHLRAGSRALFGVPWLDGAIGVNNVFDRRYAPSIVVNAARERYYEPAPRRFVWARLGVRTGEE